LDSRGTKDTSMLRTYRNVLAILASITGIACSAAIAVFDLPSLANESAAIYLVDVKEVVNPQWKDESGQRVLLAIATVESTIKGRERRDITFGFKPTVSDQAKFVAGARYVVFLFGPQRPIVLDHQPRALPVQGEAVDTTGLKGEPQVQPLAPFIARIRRVTS
jgi:hypothetical protein